MRHTGNDEPQIMSQKRAQQKHHYTDAQGLNQSQAASHQHQPPKGAGQESSPEQNSQA